MPGYESLDKPSTTILLASAWAGFASPRKTQNEAAVAALGIVFERVVLVDNAADDNAVAFVTQVVDRLERSLESAEQRRGSMEDLALHGPLSACR